MDVHKSPAPDTRHYDDILQRQAAEINQLKKTQATEQSEFQVDAVSYD